jgi:hypothetical protein
MKTLRLALLACVVAGLLLNRGWLGIAGAFVLLGLAVYLLFFWKAAGRPYDPPQNSFDGGSEALEHTVVVPTLDTPLPSNESAIWCSSFQLAWNHLKTDVAQGPIQLKNAEVLADRLNQAEQSESDFDAQDLYAAAGVVKNGIVQRIQKDMGQKFPEIPAPALNVPADGAVAYGFMRTQVTFKIPFFDNDDEFQFKGSTGKEVAVKSFGIRKKDDYAYQRLREQVQVLYCPVDVFWKEKDGGEYIVDPCKTSQPYQIILACIGRKPTLAEALADVHQKMTANPPHELATRIHPRDSLLIPSMHWRVNHRFKELEGKDKQFLNLTMKGLFLDTALQMIQFRLDRSGAELASQSKAYVLPGATYFHFDRPFLVILKKRDVKQPFFVMWVANAELLDK